MTRNAIATYPRTGTMSSPDHGIAICHPDLGWAPVSMVNETELCLSFADHHAWFSLDDPAVAVWTMRNAGELAKWIRRAAA